VFAAGDFGFIAFEGIAACEHGSRKEAVVLFSRCRCCDCDSKNLKIGHILETNSNVGYVDPHDPEYIKLQVMFD